MLTLHRSKQLHAGVLGVCRRYLATQQQPAAEYTDEPQYPEIQDLSFKGRKVRERREWHEKIRAVPTVEEKLIKMNMPRFYGFKVAQLGDALLPYNCLPAIQHYTRTVYEDKKAPDTATGNATTPAENNLKQDALLQVAKSDVQDALEHAFDFHKHKYANVGVVDPQERERIFSQLIVEQINRALINALAADCPHLHEVEVDVSPRHEAFWYVGGIDPPKNVLKSKEGRPWQKDMAKDSVDFPMQYIANPYLALRHSKQLPPWKSAAESENLELAHQIPRYKYDPRTLGYQTDYRHGTNIPGFWPSSQCSFGTISYHSRAALLLRPATYGAEDAKEALRAHAIQSSYSWLLAQANYNGFNTYNELTYPMNTQTIITNGRDWSFFEFQLNTLLVHSQYVDDNPQVNFCRGTDEMQLYQEFDQQGKLIGLNDSVLQQLLAFYTNAPTVERPLAELQPYLNPEHKRIADYANEEKRDFLERVFKHMVSNRPRHLAIPEIYMWEKIYKIDNKTRQMEPRRRFFELFQNPWKRTLDQHQKEYIPRALRADGPKSKKKWKKTFYP